MGMRYWRNLGNGRFDMPRPMAAAAFVTYVSAVQLVDANGNGRADLMVLTVRKRLLPVDLRR